MIQAQPRKTQSEQSKEREEKVAQQIRKVFLAVLGRRQIYPVEATARGPHCKSR